MKTVTTDISVLFVTLFSSVWLICLLCRVQLLRRQQWYITFSAYKAY